MDERGLDQSDAGYVKWRAVVKMVMNIYVTGNLEGEISRLAVELVDFQKGLCSMYSVN